MDECFEISYFFLHFTPSTESKKMKRKALLVHPQDNVMAALTDLPAGEAIEYPGGALRLHDAVRAKHKFSLEDLRPGDEVYMYGVLVGKATQHIPQGGLISTENLRHASSDYQVGERKTAWEVPDVTEFEGATFMGYHRANGQVGTQNIWLVIPLVFCENRNIAVMREALVRSLGYDTGQKYQLDIPSLVEGMRAGKSAEELLTTDIVLSQEASIKKRVFPHVDGIKFLTHDMGCGGTRQDAASLCRLLAGYIIHPNVAGATVLSLGCQNAQAELLQSAIQEFEPAFDKPLFILEQQKSKSEPEFIAEAVRLTFTGLMQANEISRQPAPLSKLVLGLECGGSDGFSGISANPTLGYTSDLLVALGGTAILSEFPELNGVEQELADRCVEEKTAEKFVHLMRTYNQRAVEVGSGFDANPSPGNIKDGLITDAIKSAGAAKKGGTSPVTDVLDYTEQVTRPGLNLLCTPGNDVESTTGLAGSGANVILFTTGLGTPTGNPVAPVIKVSSNTKLYDRMRDIIDFNTGPIIAGEKTIEDAGCELLKLIIEVASGRQLAKATTLGQDDFIPWKRGVSL